MATKKFLASVMDAYLYDESDNLLAISKTLIDSNLDVKLNASEVRGGRGNQLQYVYYSTGALSLSLTDTQFNLDFLSSTVGSSITTGNSVYTEETIDLTTGGAGTVVGTPLAIQGATIYGWVTQTDGTVERVTFSGSTFASSSGSSGDTVCVRYFSTDAASRSITVPANAIPKICRVVLEGQLNSSDVATNKIGVVQVIIPRATLSGSFTLSLKADGVSQTPLTLQALAYSDATTAACTSLPIYAKIIEILDNANWYDGVTAISIEGGSFSLATTTATRQLVVYAIRPGDLPFIAPVADLTFASDTVGVATVGAHTGLVTGVSAGTAVITVYITAASTIDDTCTATVPA